MTNNMEWEVTFDTQVLGRAFVCMLFSHCSLTAGCRYTLVHLVLKITRTLVSVYNHCLPNAVVIVVWPKCKNVISLPTCSSSVVYVWCGS